MARIGALITLAVALAVCAPARGDGPPCGPAAAHSLAAGALSRVYVTGVTVYGCTRGATSRRLGGTGPCQGPGAISAAVVSGRDAAVVNTVCGVDTGGATVAVVRLTDGRTLSSHPAAPVTAPESFTQVQGLVLTPGGTVAWIGCVDSIVRHTAIIRVYAASPSRPGPARTLDGGPGVVAGSLRLTGRTVSWRHGAGRRHVRL
ncbi:MAG TPA: hypothetical protein VFN55_06160 [Solirubrobacteraceae bacterium]|nr:hypothetical protein [Solirubrobacteraceae bacterium]